MIYLCVNAGSSSLKFQLFEMPEEKVIISGYIEKIGLKDSFWNTKINGEKIKGEKHLKNHNEAVEVLIEELIKHKAVKSLDEIKGVGHRVLHGGEKYSDSVIITDEVVNDIRELTKLGPLHHPGNLAGIEALREESKKDDIRLNKKLDKKHINDLKRFLITEMSKIQNKDYVPNEEQKSILKEAKKEYNDMGGDSYVDDMYEDLRDQKLI